MTIETIKHVYYQIVARISGMFLFNLINPFYSFCVVYFNLQIGSNFSTQYKQELQCLRHLFNLEN